MRAAAAAGKTLVVITFCLVGLLVVVLIYGLEPEPQVTRPNSLSLEDVARIKQVIRENNPRKLQGLGVREVHITERDLNLLVGYGLSHSRLG